MTPSSAAMRKFLALFISASLLAVSSVPAVTMASECAPSEHVVSYESTMHHEGDHAGHETGHEHDHGILPDAHVLHEHGMALAGDWQRDRIECGCGCHRSIDSLPHLLAPHTVDIAQFVSGIVSIPANDAVESVIVAIAPVVPIPPPEQL